MMDDDEDMVDFGQKVDLCQSIKGVLTNYPEGALLKEMVQNADDAGAGIFRVMLDCRSHGTTSLIAPLTAGFQGPSLMTYNNAIFTDRDFESIQHIGGSRKTDEDSKTKDGPLQCRLQQLVPRHGLALLCVAPVSGHARSSLRAYAQCQQI